jgi:hypothetical protein
MTTIANLRLSDARPDDRAHLLLWDTPNPFELNQIAFYNNAEQVSYRKNLIQRINPRDRFLNLHYQVDEELEMIKTICDKVVKPVVLLDGLDYLMTYLNTQPGDHITLFWSSLENTRKLRCLMWILLPHKLAPQTWPETRIKRISSISQNHYER